MHKRHLLMYYNKRFQKDPHFPLIAFNHERIKQSSTGGYLLAESAKFEPIVQRLMDVDTAVLNDIARRMENGEHVKPETVDEKLCFQLIKDLDHVGGHVKGSLTNKKYMRNEIWSLISFAGAPSWFITFSPADNMHPISLYFADSEETFTPRLRCSDERYKLIAENPVAAARFFHYMCEMFIKHVLGVGSSHSGFYGDTNAYYGVVEQQGRLTLHMHMLLWLIACLTPQEIRDRILDPNSDFQVKLVQYLESVHVGEFLNGTMDQVKAKVDQESRSGTYKDPTQTLPDMPPPTCDNNHDTSNDCNDCTKLSTWWDKFMMTVDDLVLRSNVHNCSRYSSSKEKDRPSCMNKNGKCKARFPRATYNETQIDPLSGALNIRKGEPWINTLTPLVTYLLRCNTDITSLLSGTAIKAVVAYITDYVTKPGLKTYSIFATIRSVFQRNSEMLGGSMERKEKARRLITKIVNALTAMMEIGAPLASMYLLGHPDHYTNFKFKHFFWKNFVREVQNAWKSPEDMEVDEEAPEKVLLLKKKGQYIGVYYVHDYVYRPEAYSDITLYEWVQMATRVKRPSKVQKADIAESSEDELNLIGQSQPQSSKFVKEQSFLVPDDTDVETDDLNLQDSDSDIEESDSFSDMDAESETEEIDADTESGEEFLEGYPLYETHIVQFDSRKSHIVPDFLGGSLPRQDRGDREYYCMTMLTIFKPWRAGKDLKSEDQSWDEAFVDHQFTDHQEKLMCYFNIRYECNDARDDFSTQLK